MEYPGDIDNTHGLEQEDSPWADPAIRTAYEAALGRFILVHNEADYRLSQVIGGRTIETR